MTWSRKCLGKLASSKLILNFTQTIRCSTGSKESEKDLTKLNEWAGKMWWFSTQQCWQHHIRHQRNSNLIHVYMMLSSEQTVATLEGLIGVITENTPEPTPQCAAEVWGKKKINQASTGRRIEYCVQFWTLHLKKEIVELEKIQRRAIKITRRMKKLLYGARLFNVKRRILWREI